MILWQPHCLLWDDKLSGQRNSSGCCVFWLSKHLWTWSPTECWQPNQEDWDSWPIKLVEKSAGQPDSKVCDQPNGCLWSVESLRGTTLMPSLTAWMTAWSDLQTYQIIWIARILWRSLKQNLRNPKPFKFLELCKKRSGRSKGVNVFIVCNLQGH